VSLWTWILERFMDAFRGRRGPIGAWVQRRDVEWLKRIVEASK
jgi:hypothetical protein